MGWGGEFFWGRQFSGGADRGVGAQGINIGMGHRGGKGL